MLLVIDIGNTRVKWALANSAGMLSEQGACMHAEVADSRLLVAAKKAKSAFVSNVAEEDIYNKINQLIAPLPMPVLLASDNACGVKNLYEQPKRLGTDRWAAAVAAWHLTQKPSVIVNAGTAITIDTINIIGSFLGGSIQPGLRLMHESLCKQTAQLKMPDNAQKNPSGDIKVFPKNTPDAITTGCINAVIGAIMLTSHRHTVHYGSAPALIITGGDADEISRALKDILKDSLKDSLIDEPKQVIIAHDLVLQGLVLLAKP